MYEYPEIDGTKALWDTQKEKKLDVGGGGKVEEHDS